MNLLSIFEEADGNNGINEKKRQKKVEGTSSSVNSGSAAPLEGDRRVQ
jgi:hypothetical protein